MSLNFALRTKTQDLIGILNKRIIEKMDFTTFDSV